MHNDPLATRILSSLQTQTGDNERARLLLDELTEEQALYREFSGRDSA